MQRNEGYAEPIIGDRCGRQRGFALIAVIWIAGLLAVMASSFVVFARSSLLATSNATQNVNAEYVADAMASLVALRMAAWNGGQAPYALNGSRYACAWSEQTDAWIAVQDQGGLVDLNTASPALLTALFQSLPMSSEAASALVARMRDYRDPDSLDDERRPEDIAYAGLKWRPKNEPFAAIEELDQIPGLSLDQFQRLRNLVTVHSQQQGIDPDRAPRALTALLGIGNEQNQAELAFLSPSPGRIFEIEVTVRLANGATYVRRTMVSLLRQPSRPFAILSWQHAMTAHTEQPPPKGRCFN